MSEEERRREAVARVLAGAAVAAVAREFRRSDRWVRKWVARYDPKEVAWAAAHSRAPHHVPNRTPAELERLVLEVRERLMAEPWAQVGAVAIAWELAKLGTQPPEVWTIDRILKRHGMPRRRARERYVPKGTPYPALPALPGPNARHELDLVGPRHLAGAVPFHVLTGVDVGRHRCAIEILPSKEEHEVASGLLEIWGRLGLPEVAQFDNGQTIQGRGYDLALPVWVCLALGVRVRFIPFAEPWRNPVVEHFNDVFDKRFFRTERFRDRAHLRRRARAFEAFHDTHHRYSALRGATPAEWEARLHFRPRFPDPAFRIPAALPRRGRIEFVRLIRSDRLLRVLDAKIELPERLIHRYVTATLHVRTEQLVVEAEGLAWKRELHFPLRG